MTRLAAIASVLALGAVSAASAQETARTPRTLRLDHGIVVTLPEGWQPESGDLTEETENGFDASGFRRVRVECKTEDCETTQEACTFVLRKERVVGADDASRLASLYDTALARYFRIRAVLSHTSVGASLRKPLTQTPLGPRDWWLVETQAAPRYKSGLFAETVIGGWYLGAICKTCETGEDRHEGARDILSSVREAKDSGS